MQPKPQESRERYTGPVTVLVQPGEWVSFEEHAPGWWPRRFERPSRDLVARVDRRLRELLAA
jgi:hypothetical protein